MRFDLRDNCRFLHGCVALETKEKGLQLHRLTPSLQEIFCCTEHRWIRALCPSGIRILLKTDSAKLRLPVVFGRIARPVFAFSVWVDGMETAYSRDGDVLELALDGKMHQVEIALPHLVECFVGALEAEDGARVEPVPRKERTMLFIGDSIMQGMTVSRPSLAYADRLARFLESEYCNLSVAGATADQRLGSCALEYEWDRALLGFGVNDFNTSRPLGAYLEDMKGTLLPLLSRKDADVFLLGPIPWAGRTEPNDLGLHLDDYCEALRGLAAEFPRVRFIDGRTLLPDDPAYYVDGIHPNDSGSELLFRNLKRLFAEESGR